MEVSVSPQNTIMTSFLIAEFHFIFKLRGYVGLAFNLVGGFS